MNATGRIWIVWAGCIVLGGALPLVAERGVGLTPDAEFTVLSDTGAAPESAVPAVAPGAAVADPAPEASPAGVSEHPAAPEAPAAAASPAETPAAAPEATAEGVGVPAPAAPTAQEAATETIPVAAQTAAGDRQNLITIALDDVPLQDVVKLFTRVSGANIIATTSNLQGKVTVNLQDVEWKPALDSILEMHGMMVSEKVPGSGIYSILPRPPGAAEPLIAQPLFLEYATVSNVASVVQSMVGPGGMVSPFPNANALVIRTTAANLSEIRKVVQSIDLPRQQVYIEAKFIELTDEAIKDLGVNWEILSGYGLGVSSLGATFTDSRSKFNGERKGLGAVDSDVRPVELLPGAGIGTGQRDYRTRTDTVKSGGGTYAAGSSALSDDGLSTVARNNSSRDVADTIEQQMNYSREKEKIDGRHLSDVRTAVLDADDFKVVLSALKQLNGVSIVSNPKIIVANEETATIHIGENEPNIKGSVTAGQQGQANTQTYALDENRPYFEFGISVDVTPTINNQSNIAVRIEPKLSRYLRDKLAPDGNSFPVESTKKIKTLFSMESGKTAAIGGLTETEDRDEVKKIPLLGDIPLIGKYLFSHQHQKRVQKETIIFVTVGLANAKALERDQGLPEDAVLVQKHMAARKIMREQAAKAGGEKPATNAAPVEAKAP
jgi:type IV pilus assembly protein PilQ